MNSAAPHLEPSAVSYWQSPGFTKWWPRCPNQDASKAWQSQRTCEAVSEACLHLSHLGLFTSPCL